MEIISLDELAVRIGMDAMPGLSGKVQKKAMTLPIDDYSSTKENKNPKKSEPDNQQILLVLVNLVLTIFEWIISLFKS